jgi:nitrite reductase/ring-hydroxylating ferredoxin subunit
MIQNQWYIVADSREVRKGRPIGLKRLGEELVLWRDENGKVICLRDRCVHRGAALSIGKLVNHHLQCPFHGLEFNAEGKCVQIPANGKMELFQKFFNYKASPLKSNLVGSGFGGEQRRSKTCLPSSGLIASTIPLNRILFSIPGPLIIHER